MQTWLDYASKYAFDEDDDDDDDDDYNDDTNNGCWLRGIVVERQFLTGELSLSCARPAAGIIIIIIRSRRQQTSVASTRSGHDDEP